MPTPATKDEATNPTKAMRIEEARTYFRSVKIEDVASPTPDNPRPEPAPFVNPDPRSIHKFDLTQK
jgi:hypothetical protein